MFFSFFFPFTFLSNSLFWVLFWVKKLFWVLFWADLTFLSTFLSNLCFLSTFFSTFFSTFLFKHFFECFFEYFFEYFFCNFWASAPLLHIDTYFFLGTIEITEMTEIVVNLFELEGIEKVRFHSKRMIPKNTLLSNSFTSMWKISEKLIWFLKRRLLSQKPRVFSTSWMWMAMVSRQCLLNTKENPWMLLLMLANHPAIVCCQRKTKPKSANLLN